MKVPFATAARSPREIPQDVCVLVPLFLLCDEPLAVLRSSLSCGTALAGLWHAGHRVARRAARRSVVNLLGPAHYPSGAVAMEKQMSQGFR